MKILITGGTGFVGGALVAQLRAAGHTCFVVSRRTKGPGTLTYDQQAPAVDAVINLAGERIAGLWTPAKKRRILESRLKATRWCVDQIRGMQPRPTVFLSTSAIGLYGHRPGERLTESSAPASSHDFLTDVCVKWEALAQEVEALAVRTVRMRFGHVMHPSGGFLGPLMPLYRLGVCIGLGDPDAYLSWISRKDLLRAMEWFLTQERASGAFHLTAPQPCTNRELYDALAQSVGKTRAWAFVPPVLLQIGMGEFSSALLRDQQVIPEKLQTQLFPFRHSRISDALTES